MPYDKRAYSDEQNRLFTASFEGMKVPDDIRAAAQHICAAYGINGLCDPAYIANVIAMHTGRGDGKSNFYFFDKP